MGRESKGSVGGEERAGRWGGRELMDGCKMHDKCIDDGWEKGVALGVGCGRGFVGWKWGG